MNDNFEWNDIIDNKEEYEKHILDFIKNDFILNNKKGLKVSLKFTDPLDTIIEVKIYNKEELKTLIYQPINSHRIEEKGDL